MNPKSKLSINIVASNERWTNGGTGLAPIDWDWPHPEKKRPRLKPRGNEEKIKDLMFWPTGS
jgi:hypothetical protein